MSSTTDLDTLVINYLTQAQYESAKSGGTIDPDQIYLTPAQGTGVTDVEVDGSSVVSGGVAEVDLSGKADVSHTHTKSQITDFPTIPTITDTYSSTSSNGMSGKAVNSALQTLDGTVSGTAGSGKTLTAFSQTDGKVSATFGNISITKSQISDFPAIPTITDTYSGTSSDGMSGKAVKSAIDALDGTISGSPGSGKTLTAFSQTDGKVSATFGNISITKSQVSDFPTIPTVNNATLTIQKNSTNVATFTANASSNVTADISVPTDTGDLTNGAGFTTNAGTVTSVRVQATSPVQSSSDTAQSTTLNTTISLASAYGDTLNPYGSKTKNYVLASPSSEAGTPSFRALVSDDIPDLSGTYLTAETDPVFSASAAAGITATDISNWNNGKLSLDTTAAAGTTDGDLYAAIVALGWASDVIE